MEWNGMEGNGMGSWEFHQALDFPKQTPFAPRGPVKSAQSGISAVEKFEISHKNARDIQLGVKPVKKPAVANMLLKSLPK